jgi:hypothetical protein
MSTDHITSGTPAGTDDEMLFHLQKDTLDYFLQQADATTGLIVDKTQPGSPASVAAVGMGISSYISGVDQKMISRADAAGRTLRVLRFFANSPQNTDPDATGYKGFYYHFLDMRTGKRAWRCELSTIDTALLIAGVLSAVNYFTNDDASEKEIRDLGTSLYLRIDWKWALDRGSTISHGWNPESGFLPYRWDNNYSEAILLYVLALGSPTYPIDPTSYKLWTATFTKRTIYSFECIYAGPLFIHQFSHLWLDFRGIFDDVTKAAGFDYFENSRRATYIHREYAIRNPQEFAHYGPFNWGQTASDGPMDGELKINGIQRTFYGYKARGAPFGPDDGTISPWAVVASLPFAPEIVIDTIRHAIERFDLKRQHEYGFDASFNPTYPEKNRNPNGWVSPWKFGLNQGPVIMMIANYKSSLFWNVMKRCSYIRQGLLAAGFSGGWLAEKRGTENH